jgi:RNA polymerase sigma-70 factor, ECF subfamily
LTSAYTDQSSRRLESHRGPILSERSSVTDDLVNDSQFESDVIPLLRPLYLRAIRMTGSQTDAEDLLQETVLRAYACMHSFTPGTNLKAWMHRIMTSIFIDNYRKSRRRPTQDLSGEITDRQLVASAARWQTALPSAEDRALEKLPDPRIQAAMLCLPEKYRVAVYFADVAGLPYREIACILGIQLGTVRSRLKRGRCQLRRLLTPPP